MTVELRILGGARAGQTEKFDKSVILIGRHPMSDLRFDAELDRDVSTRHAEIRVVGERVTLIDNQSTNGTFVNGTRVAGEWSLKSGDQISFGKSGPSIEVRVATPPTADPPHDALAGRTPSRSVPVPRTSITPTDGPPRASQQGGQLRASTTQRVAVAVREQTNRLRYALFALAAIVILGGGAAVWFGRSAQNASRAQLDQMLARYDSVSSELNRMQAQVGLVAGLSDSLAASQREAARLQAQMRSGSASTRDLAAFQQQVDAVRQLQQVSTDATGVFSANSPAVTTVLSWWVGGTRDSTPDQGTGFAISADGWVVTNRHMVRSPTTGAPARLIGVKFSGQSPSIQMVVAAVDSEFDLALLKPADPADLTLLSSPKAPVIAGIRSAQPAIGANIYIIGFPNSQSIGYQPGQVPRPTLTGGHVSNLAPDTLQVDAFAAPGASGSPVLDGDGMLVGVVFGGPPGSSGKIVFAVPSRAVLTLLGSRGTALAR